MLSLFKICMLILFYRSESCWATEDWNGNSIVSMLERKSKANVVSFQPLGENLALGLDFLLPFITVPLVREVDANGNEPALININSAALVSTGLLAGSSALLAYILKTYIVFKPNEEKSKKTRRTDSNFEYELLSMLNNIKVIYKNSTGAKVDTTLPVLLSTIDDTFHQKGIALSECLQKALCQRIQRSVTPLPGEHHISGIDKIIDGLTSLKWFRQNVLQHIIFNEVIDNMEVSNGPQSRPLTCDGKFPRCKWSAPAESLTGLLGTYLKFT